MNIVSTMVFTLAIGVCVFSVLIWRGFSQDWLPEELKGASLVLVEVNLITDVPFRVVGRPDQVYRLANGDHVPVENKNRDDARVYDTDIAQLSLQAWLLRLTGRPTTSFGYVAINSQRIGKRKSIRVNLYPDAVCERIIRRYLDVTEGRVVAKKSIGGKCKFCGHRPICHAD